MRTPPSPKTPARPLGLDQIDATVALLLAAGTIAYILALPWFMNDQDEGYYLYHALRVLNGEVLYRDVVELVTPLYIDVMALLFAVFGPWMATARTASAVIQAGIVTLIYTTCRALGVRRPLAATASLPHLAIGYMAWPFATPHWLGSFLVSLLVLVNIDRRRARQRGRLVAQGLIVGGLLCNRQPTGVIMALAVTVLLLADRIADHRWRSEPRRALVRPIALVAAVAAAVVFVFLGAHALQAGIGPMYQQLVIVPLTGYRAYNRINWGDGAWPWINRYTYPTVIKYLPPTVLAIALGRTVWTWWSGLDRRDAETLTVLLVGGAFSVASILYYPDVVHIAFILPVVLVLAADIVESLVPLGTAGAWLGVLLAGGLFAASGAQLARSFVRTQEDFPFVHETAFGHVALRSQGEATGVDHMRQLLNATPDRGLFIYPGWAAAYLWVGGRNPTPYDLILPQYQNNDERQGVIDALARQDLQGLIDTLERRRPRYIVITFVLKGDPVVAYVEQHYHTVDGLYVRNEE